jgi:hypothetical protein
MAEVAEIGGGWCDKRAIAAYFGCSVRSIERRMVEGMPHAEILGRAKFRVPEVEPWLEEHGYLKRKGQAA